MRIPLSLKLDQMLLGNLLREFCPAVRPLVMVKDIKQRLPNITRIDHNFEWLNVKETFGILFGQESVAKEEEVLEAGRIWGEIFGTTEINLEEFIGALSLEGLEVDLIGKAIEELNPEQWDYIGVWQLIRSLHTESGQIILSLREHKYIEDEYAHRPIPHQNYTVPMDICFRENPVLSQLENVALSINKLEEYGATKTTTYEMSGMMKSLTPTISMTPIGMFTEHDPYLLQPRMTHRFGGISASPEVKLFPLNVFTIRQLKKIIKQQKPMKISDLKSVLEKLPLPGKDIKLPRFTTLVKRVHPRLDEFACSFLYSLVEDVEYETVAPNGFVLICSLLCVGSTKEKMWTAAEIAGNSTYQIFSRLVGIERAAALSVWTGHPQTVQQWKLSSQGIQRSAFPEVDWLWSSKSD